MKSNGFIVVLVYIIKAAQSMTMIQAADEPMPLRIAPILKPPASSPPVHAKTAYTKHTNLRTQGQPPLIYGGNPVIHTPRVYLVFWGSQWINNDPSGEAAIITSLMQGIGGSTWLNTVTQYCSGTGVGSASCTAGSGMK